MIEKEHHSIITACLAENQLLPTAALRWHKGAGDGSDRFFYRVEVSDTTSYLAVLPSPTLERAMAEAEACSAIGRHLHGHGVPVPEILAYDGKSGLVIYEDLGNLLLHDRLQSQGTKAGDGMRQLYIKALEGLVALQIKGARQFDAAWCWDTRRYDQQLILAREAGYFRDALCGAALGLDCPQQLDAEFHALAGRAASEPADFLLHRDFQCRNLMVQGESIRIIDFQGARFGPLAYDLASLLNDPYACLEQEFRQELLNYYLDLAGSHIFLDPSAFIEGYYHIALCRNLQVLGAFAFLSGQRGKTFFAAYLRPALDDLIYKLEYLLPGEYPALTSMAFACQERLLDQREELKIK